MNIATPNGQLRLPLLDATFRRAIPAVRHLVVVGGRPPAPQWLQAAAKGSRLWAVDHGLDACRRAGLVPLRFLGDGDSAAADAWQWCAARQVPSFRYPPEKDFTDTQLALQMLAAEGESLAVVTGAFGGRFDHAFSTVHSCAHAAVPCVLADEQEALFFLKGDDSLRLHCHARPRAVSLLPLTDCCRGVATKRLKWPLADATLHRDEPAAISNEPEDACFSVSLRQGILGVYLSFMIE